MARDSDVVPRVAVKNHMDGDPEPRGYEVQYFQRVRKRFELEEMLVLVLTPNPLSAGQFPGYDMHWWRLSVHGVEPTEVELVVEGDARRL